ADLRASRVLVRSIIVLMLVAPLGYHFGLVDPYFAHCLYAGNTPRAFLHSKGGQVQELRFLPEARVFLPPAHRIFEQFYFATAKPNDALEIQDPRPWAAMQGWDRRMITLGGEYRRGKRHGPWTFWYKNGQKMSQGSYFDDQQEGPWIFWSEDGRKEAEG